MVAQSFVAKRTRKPFWLKPFGNTDASTQLADVANVLSLVAFGKHELARKLQNVKVERMNSCRKYWFS